MEKEKKIIIIELRERERVGGRNNMIGIKLADMRRIFYVNVILSLSSVYAMEPMEFRYQLLKNEFDVQQHLRKNNFVRDNIIILREHKKINIYLKIT